jgi:glycosyltransferase involved in cell wall biosynthesis
MGSEKLRICMFATFYPPYHFGGDGVYVYRLAGALARQGHEVDVVHSRDAHSIGASSLPMPKLAEQPGVRRIELKSKVPMLAALAAHQRGAPAFYEKQLREVVDSGNYDVFHYHNVSLLGAPELLKMGRGVKLFTPHEYWLICPTHVLFRYDKEACEAATCLSCTLSQRRPPQLWRQGTRLADAMSHVDLMLPPSRFALERHRAAGFDVAMSVLSPLVPFVERASAPVVDSGARPYFLYAGRLEKLKGVQDLIEVFGRNDRADLCIVGCGTYEAALRKKAEGLSNVRFLGARHPDDLGELYRGAVALMAPSLCYETFGLTVAEASMQGTPSIVRRHGALAELTEDLRVSTVDGADLELGPAAAGFSSLSECSDVMNDLLDDTEARQGLANSARARAEALWSEDVHLQSYLSAIEQLLSRRGAATVTH